ncbi:MAG: hypothetical protein WCP79_02840 [Bacillota bacterium]
MKKIAALILVVALVAALASVVSAAPLTNFKDNSFQIDVAWNPNNIGSMNNVPGQIIWPGGGGTINFNQALPNSGEFSGNVTWAFSSFAAVRVGASGVAPQSMTPQNLIENPESVNNFGMTQVNAQLVVALSDYFQPFVGLQYATTTASGLTDAANNWNQTKQSLGWCVGGQFTVPVANILKFNSSAMYGTFMSSAYVGASLALGQNIDFDAGYSYELYNSGKLLDANIPDMNLTTTNVTTTLAGPRIGVSFRI